jgi:undecaprenyl-diphosphatase
MMSLFETIEKLDRELFLLINQSGNTSLDPVMVFFSHRGAWVPFYAILLYFLYRQFKKRTYLFLFTVSICVFLSDKFSVYVKNGFERYRPCYNEELIGIVRIVDGCGGKFGFVSSHAANTFGLALFLSYFMRERYNWIPYIMFTWAAIVSLSRTYLGVHYPTDIIGGAVIGLLAALVTIILHKRLEKRFFDNELIVK